MPICIGMSLGYILIWAIENRCCACILDFSNLICDLFFKKSKI